MEDSSRPSSIQLNRRHILLAALAGSLAMDRGLLAQTANNRSLQQPMGDVLMETRLKMELEVEGEAKALTLQGTAAKPTPIKSKAIQEYLETVAYQGGKPLGSARHYMTAKSDNWISGKILSHTLRPEITHVTLVQRDGVWDHFCPDQPLLQREIELLRSPLNSAALEKILPTEPARIDSQWPITAADAKDLFNLDAVNQCTLVAKVSGVEKSVVTIEFEGSLQAVANSVPTEISVKGKAQAKLASHGAMIHWLGLSLREAREISESQPGFAVTARLQIAREEIKGKLPASFEQLAQLASNTDQAAWLVRLQSKANFTALVSRNWLTLIDSSEDVVLRCVENNRVIAQCNIAPLPKLDAGTQLTLEGLQEDMRSTLGKSFDEFIESSERLTGTKLRMLRCEAVGKQEEVPIHWVYAHLSDDSGRRLLLIFTYAAEFAERLSGADLQLLDSLEFTSTQVKPPEVAQPGPQATSKSTTKSAAAPTQKLNSK